jgi:hypothetical protein
VRKRPQTKEQSGRGRAHAGAIRPTAVSAIALVLTALAGAPAQAQVPTRGLADPPANIVASPAMVDACYAAPAGNTCEHLAVLAIDEARATEGVEPLVLPAGYARLPLIGQLLVVTDLERTARGLRGFSGLSVALDTMALAGAEVSEDPTGPAGAGWGSNLALGFPTALQADYSWMYDDGPGSNNMACTSASLAGCWGHRHNILGDYGPNPSTGAAVATVDWEGEKCLAMTQLFVAAPPGVIAYKLPSLPS